MPVNKIGQYLVIYDIGDPKRLQRIHRVLKKQGLPIQFSVFSVLLTKSQLSRLMQQLEDIMDLQEDDLRCYGLPNAIQCTNLGQQFFPEDVLLFSKGVNRLMV